VSLVPHSVDPARRLWVAVPAYTGEICAGTAQAIYYAGLHALADGLFVSLDILAGCCYLDLARNTLVDRFMASDATDLLFIDADLTFPAEAIAQIAAVTKPVVCGVYPKKGENQEWPAELPAGENWSDAEGCLELTHAPTGFLRIHRSVFEAMAPHVPVHGKPDKSGPMPAYFQCVARDGMYWGEDYEFCNRWRALGGKLYCLPEIPFEHIGQRHWKGRFGDYLRGRPLPAQEAA